MENFGCPARVRSDHGTENIAVARFILVNRTTVNTLFITGRSVHNQRIERLWRDVAQYIIIYYKNLFYCLEDEGKLNPSDEVHLFALKYVYLPRINRSINEFLRQWNNHSLRTEHSQSPLQLWTAGIHSFSLSNLINITDVLDYNQCGIDFDGPLPEIETSNVVEVPQPEVTFNNDELDILNSLIQPLNEDGAHGTSLYEQTVEIMNQLLLEQE